MANKPERNDPCHCGSAKKYKNCCMGKDQSPIISKLGITGLVLAVILAIIIVGIKISGGDDSRNCPPGTEWSETHQHCH